jgi:hypothetical protein
MSISDAAVALGKLGLDAERAPLDERLPRLHQRVLRPVPLTQSGALDPAAVEDESYQIANHLGLNGELGGETERRSPRSPGW